MTLAMTIIHRRSVRQQPNGQWWLFWEAYLNGERASQYDLVPEPKDFATDWEQREAQEYRDIFKVTGE